MLVSWHSQTSVQDQDHTSLVTGILHHHWQSDTATGTRALEWKLGTDTEENEDHTEGLGPAYWGQGGRNEDQVAHRNWNEYTTT